MCLTAHTEKVASLLRPIMITIIKWYLRLQYYIFSQCYVTVTSQIVPNIIVTKWSKCDILYPSRYFFSDFQVNINLWLQNKAKVRNIWVTCTSSQNGTFWFHSDIMGTHFSRHIMAGNVKNETCISVTVISIKRKDVKISH